LGSSVLVAAKRAREPIVILVPLIWLAVPRNRLAGSRTDPIPRSKTVADVPLYAFDKHTRLGNLAIASLVRENKPFRDCLVRFLFKGSPTKAAEIAAFYAA